MLRRREVEWNLKLTSEILQEALYQLHVQLGRARKYGKSSDGETISIVGARANIIGCMRQLAEAILIKGEPVSFAYPLIEDSAFAGKVADADSNLQLSLSILPWDPEGLRYTVMVNYSK